MNGRNRKIDFVGSVVDGVFVNNPILVQVLGTCPTLATTTSALNGVGMGLCAMAVLMLTNLLISLLRKIIPPHIRIASYVVIIAAAVTALELLMKAYLPSLASALGLFIPLIVVNCIILARAEAFASKNAPLPSLLDGFSMGLGYTLALLVIGSIREILGSGTWFGISVFGPAYKPAMLFIMPAGAFFTMAAVMAPLRFVKTKVEAKRAARSGEEECDEYDEYGTDDGYVENDGGSDAAGEKEVGQ